MSFYKHYNVYKNYYYTNKNLYTNLIDFKTVLSPPGYICRVSLVSVRRSYNHDYSNLIMSDFGPMDLDPSPSSVDRQRTKEFQRTKECET